MNKNITINFTLKVYHVVIAALCITSVAGLYGTAHYATIAGGAQDLNETYCHQLNDLQQQVGELNQKIYDDEQGEFKRLDIQCYSALKPAE